MPRIQKLDDGETLQALADLGEWTIDGGKLLREFAFADFSQAGNNDSILGIGYQVCTRQEH